MKKISSCTGNTRREDHLLPYVYNSRIKYILRPWVRFRRRGVYTRFIVVLKIIIVDNKRRIINVDENGSPYAAVCVQ